MAANALDLTTKEDVKLWLGKDGQSLPATDDPIIEKLITAASRFMLGEMNRDSLKEASLTDYFDGLGGYDYFPRFWPVTSVTSVQVGSQVIPVAADHLSNGYFVTERNGVDAIHLKGYCFTWGKNNCKIVYKYGYVLIPDDVAQACKELVGLRYRDRKRIGVVSENIGQGMVASYSQKDMSDFTQEVINNYAVVS